jgi:hypothetical protein
MKEFRYKYAHRKKKQKKKIQLVCPKVKKRKAIRDKSLTSLSSFTNLLNFETNLGLCMKNSYKQTLTIKLGDVRLAEKLSSNPTAHYRKSKYF